MSLTISILTRFMYWMIPVINGGETGIFLKKTTEAWLTHSGEIRIITNLSIVGIIQM